MYCGIAGGKFWEYMYLRIVCLQCKQSWLLKIKTLYISFWFRSKHRHIFDRSRNNQGTNMVILIGYSRLWTDFTHEETKMRLRHNDHFNLPSLNENETRLEHPVDTHRSDDRVLLWLATRVSSRSIGGNCCWLSLLSPKSWSLVRKTTNNQFQWK